jgi:hypothetical protein
MKRSISMKKQGMFWASASAILLTLCFLPGIAHANHVAVNCPVQSLSAAVAALPPNGPNTVTVTGECNNESVSITDMGSLTIVAGAGGAKILQRQDSDTFDIFQSQNITLQGLEIVGVPGSMPGSGGRGVTAANLSSVRIVGCDIHDNEGGGLNVFNTSTALVAGTTIQNNGSPGVSNPANLTAGIGVVLASNSGIIFRLSNRIQNNADIGILARDLSTVNFGIASGITIQGNHTNGISIMEGSHLQVDGAAALIQGNGVGCPPQGPIACGGIFATENATVEFNGSGTISGNQGAGIFVEQGSNVHLGGGVTVSNNSGDGVHIQRISIADFTPIPGSGSVTITDNGGASVFCDRRSLAIGNLAGLSNVQCGQREERENTQR